MSIDFHILAIVWGIFFFLGPSIPFGFMMVSIEDRKKSAFIYAALIFVAVGLLYWSNEWSRYAAEAMKYSVTEQEIYLVNNIATIQLNGEEFNLNKHTERNYTNGEIVKIRKYPAQVSYGIYYEYDERIDY